MRAWLNASLKVMVLEVKEKLLGLGTLIWSVMEDLAQCLTQGNADAVRKLQDIWLEQANLPSKV